MQEIICGIYMIQNKINGKIYIGQSNNIYQRWKAHIYTSINYPKHYIHYALHSVGQDNFSFSILERCSPQLLDSREQFYIALYHSTDKRFGYNLTHGGNRCEWSKELKKKHSRILTKVHNSKEFRENASRKMKEFWKENRNMIISNRKDMYQNKERIKKLSEKGKLLWKNQDYRKHMSEMHKGKITHKNDILIKCLETNEIKSAYEWYKLGYITIIKVCRGLLQTCKDYHFECIDKDKYNLVSKEEINRRNKNINIQNKRLCLDPFTGLPISYSSLNRKKRTKIQYADIVLKDCLIKEEDLEYYQQLRTKIRTMPYTYANSKEQNKAWKLRNIEKENLRQKLKRERMCLDPITQEKIRYDTLIYRKRTKPEYKNIILKDCVIS